MSKRKLLINEVFKQAKKESGRDTKSGVASYLWTYFEEHLNFIISDKTFIRYYESFLENDQDVNINPDRLDKLSQYIGYKSFKDFSHTSVKNISEGENTTSVKLLLDGEEISVPEKIFNIIIKITNNPNFNVPDFMKKNGLGVLEFIFVFALVTGGVVFSTDHSKSLSFSSLKSSSESKSYMYWNGNNYIETDSSDLGPQIEVIPMNIHDFKYLKKITRPDTLTVDNALGKVWYDKSNNNVEFFTSYGEHPENGKTLKEATEYIIETYGGE